MSKFTVLKNDEVVEYGTEEQRKALYDLLVEIELNRAINDQSNNRQYLVVNLDEPYAQDIINILNHHGVDPVDA
ncbi:hypothetical protein MOB65_19270 [Bacillus inaquosorum]|uniref:hypothetical protein n=1 Tax=Bacillus inaquosorum TaxID=483913 RepID=UPI00227FDFC9|nr:hypothetical protein [Bacillus inaquosorum]MCY7911005.1 hypothetical protein [Bacillus inaquosorum]